jgi:hypothetical protein
MVDNESDCPARLEDLLKYLGKKQLTDPWGSPFVMKCGPGVPTQTHFGVISLGPDKREGTDDDMHSWDSSPPHR